MAFGTVNTKTGSNAKLQDGVSTLDRDIREVKLVKEFTHNEDSGNIYEVIKFKTKNEFYYRDTAGYLRTYDITTNTYSDRNGAMPAGKVSFFGNYVIKGNSIYDQAMTLVATMPGTIFLDFEKAKMYCYTFVQESESKATITVWNINTSTFSASQIFTDSYTISKNTNGTRSSVTLAYVFAKGNYIYFGITTGVPGTTTYKYIHYSLDLVTGAAATNSLNIGNPYKSYDTLGVLYNGSNIVLYHGTYTNSYGYGPEIDYYIIKCSNDSIEAKKIAEYSYGHKSSVDSRTAVHNSFLMLSSDSKSLSYLYTYGKSVEVRQVANGDDFTGYKGKSADYMIFADGKKVSIFEY